ncbi:MAG: hypothetical protein ACYS7M_12440, partial [Planctomycetota bacterium]
VDGWAAAGELAARRIIAGATTARLRSIVFKHSFIFSNLQLSKQGLSTPLRLMMHGGRKDTA